MTNLIYRRQSRTPSSEQYQVLEGEQSLGHLDLHFGSSEVYGSLMLELETPEDRVVQIIDTIDQDLVLSSDIAREDFLVRVYVGREVGFYSDALTRDEYVSDGHEELEAE
jgi:hypothetical protein